MSQGLFQTTYVEASMDQIHSPKNLEEQEIKKMFLAGKGAFRKKSIHENDLNNKIKKSDRMNLHNTLYPNYFFQPNSKYNRISKTRLNSITKKLNHIIAAKNTSNFCGKLSSSQARDFVSAEKIKFLISRSLKIKNESKGIVQDLDNILNKIEGELIKSLNKIN